MTRTIIGRLAAMPMIVKAPLGCKLRYSSLNASPSASAHRCRPAPVPHSNALEDPVAPLHPEFLEEVGRNILHLRRSAKSKAPALQSILDKLEVAVTATEAFTTAVADTAKATKPPPADNRFLLHQC